MPIFIKIWGLVVVVVNRVFKYTYICANFCDEPTILTCFKFNKAAKITILRNNCIFIQQALTNTFLKTSKMTSPLTSPPGPSGRDCWLVYGLLILYSTACQSADIGHYDGETYRPTHCRFEKHHRSLIIYISYNLIVKSLRVRLLL